MNFTLKVTHRCKEIMTLDITLQDKLIQESSLDTIKPLFSQLETMFREEIKKIQELKKKQVGESSIDRTIQSINTEQNLNAGIE